MDNEEEKLAQERKKIVIQIIIDACLKAMERVITGKKAKKRARSERSTFHQSKTAMAEDMIFFKTITGEQHLPARPQDFRLNLTEEGKNIGNPELSDILKFMVDADVLDNKRTNFPFSRGRPKPYLAEERRGRPSYYEPSALKIIIDEVLNDKEAVHLISEALIASDMLYRFISYSFETALYLAKEDEQAFHNRYKPAISRYGLHHLKQEEKDEWLVIRDLSDGQIKSLAKAFARNTINEFHKYEKDALFTIPALIYYTMVDNAS